MLLLIRAFLGGILMGPTFQLVNLNQFLMKTISWKDVVLTKIGKPSSLSLAFSTKLLKFYLPISDAHKIHEKLVYML